jgi:hypothetical protein
MVLCMVWEEGSGEWRGRTDTLLINKRPGTNADHQTALDGGLPGGILKYIVKKIDFLENDFIQFVAKLLRIYSIKKNCFIRCKSVPWSGLDKIEEVHDAFLHAERVVVVFGNLKRHKLWYFCKRKWKTDTNMLLSLSLRSTLGVGWWLLKRVRGKSKNKTWGRTNTENWWQKRR